VPVRRVDVVLGRWLLVSIVVWPQLRQRLSARFQAGLAMRVPTVAVVWHASHGTVSKLHLRKKGAPVVRV
jgi:hypothetical protein